MAKVVAVKRKNTNDSKAASQRVSTSAGTPGAGTAGRRRVSVRRKLAMLLLSTLAIVIALAGLVLAALSQIGQAHVRAERVGALLISERVLEQARVDKVGWFSCSLRKGK